MWSVAQCETRREHIAARFLTDQGFETYLPKIRIKKRVVPLFPSYVFVRILDRWYPINSTVGVVHLLLAGDQPARLNDKIVNEIKQKERHGIVRLPDPKGLRPGQKVRVIRGAFEGHVGIYQGMSGKDRERILLELLGRKVSVELAKGVLISPPQHVAP
jgi:transcriptional antiterminator RfaH